MMRRILPIVTLAALVLFGCHRDDSAKEDHTTEVIEEEVDDGIDTTAENILSVTNIPSMWKVEVQKDHKEKLVEPTEKNILETSEVIAALNNSYPEVVLHFDKTSHDTIYLSIPESTYLTEQMGSTGSYNYMATVVYNLTEAIDINCVHFNFENGDHASSGTYDRDDFKRLR